MIYDRCTNPYPSGAAYRDVPAYMYAWTNMHTIVYITVMIYARTGIDDRVLANTRVAVHNCAGYNYRPGADFDIGRDS